LIYSMIISPTTQSHPQGPCLVKMVSIGFFILIGRRAELTDVVIKA
jgi:hypothetical protein